MFLLWFRKTPPQDRVRLETGKPGRRSYKEAGERRGKTKGRLVWRDGWGCLWRTITEQDFNAENCQHLVTDDW